jgi:Xaa-Pro aminopeptidase
VKTATSRSVCGIGNGDHAWPRISSTAMPGLEEGMTFSIGPGFCRRGRFASRREGIVILPADFPRILSSLARALPPG